MLLVHMDLLLGLEHFSTIMEKPSYLFPRFQSWNDDLVRGAPHMGEKSWGKREWEQPRSR